MAAPVAHPISLNDKVGLPKRVFDLAMAVIGLGVLWPLFAFVALFVKADTAGPVFFRQERIGYRGQRFRIWKFRTMVLDAESRGLPLTVGEDARITRTGRLLRALKLDELPQLLNVLSGEMSLVGPRPEVPRYVALYTPAQQSVLEVMPGLTDPASMKYREEAELLRRSPDPELTYIEEVMPEKIRLNLKYAASATVWSDLLVILNTVWLLLPLRRSAIDAGQ